jgi:PEP-CTERM motif
MHLRLLVICGLLLLCPLAHGSSIVLESSGSGLYQYELILTPGSSIDNSQTITLTGLSGVTGVVLPNPVLSPSFFAFFTSTSVTVYEFGPPFSVSGDFTDFLVLGSTSPSSGEVAYTINSSPTSSSGMVVGPVPVNATPEPSSFALLCTGLLGLAGVVKRRFA